MTHIVDYDPRTNIRAIEKLTELDSLYKAASQMGKDYKSKRVFWVYDLSNVDETRR